MSQRLQENAMKKLWLAVCISATVLVSAAAFAAASADASEPTRRAADAAAEQWAKQVALDMQLSAEPLARATAEVSLQMMANTSRSAPTPLTQAQIQALNSSKTPIPIRLLYLYAACANYSPHAVCSDEKIADALSADDAKNAFTVLSAELLYANAARDRIKKARAEPKGENLNTEFEALAKHEHLKIALRTLKALSASDVFYDYAQDYKQPILLAVKRRPPPAEAFASLPAEIAMLLAAFPPEELAAEAFVNNLIIQNRRSGYSLTACLTPSNAQLKAQCARAADLILANPKNSLASAGFTLTDNPQHTYAVRTLSLFSSFAQKELEPAALLSLDWLGLRGVLSKAANQGDVAAIPDALAWAEAASAKLPNKSAAVLADEAKATAALSEPYRTPRPATPPSVQAMGAAAPTVELKFDALPADSMERPSGSGCTPDADEAIDLEAIEFKN
jgi:hypothetical protein